MKISSTMLCTSVVLIVITTVLGAWIGKQQEFLYSPAHGHLSLLGGNLLFLFGLYYKLVPRAGAMTVAKIQGWLHIIGAIVFPIGLALTMVVDPSYTPLMLVGIVCILVAMILFAFVVFKTSND
jgi:hypothetical protein